MFTITAGMKNGPTRPGPFSSRILCHSRIGQMPPIPEPTRQPARVGSTWSQSSFASSTASAPAATAKWMNRSIFLTSFLSMYL